MSVVDVRGMGQPRTIRHLKNKLRHYQPQILFLIKTKLSTRMEIIRKKVWYEFGIDIGENGSKGIVFKVEEGLFCQFEELF